MARIFDTKVRAREFCKEKNKRARKYRHVFQKYHGGYLVTKRKK